jgi:hypothetical protein
MRRGEGEKKRRRVLVTSDEYTKLALFVARHVYHPALKRKYE